MDIGSAMAWAVLTAILKDLYELCFRTHRKLHGVVSCTPLQYATKAGLEVLMIILLSNANNEIKNLWPQFMYIHI